MVLLQVRGYKNRSLRRAGRRCISVWAQVGAGTDFIVKLVVGFDLEGLTALGALTVHRLALPPPFQGVFTVVPLQGLGVSYLIHFFP